MKTKITILFSTLMLCFVISGAQSVRTELTADFGPPAEANVWEKFVIPITPESFGTDEATLLAALSNITSFWIRTEMHNGNDIGGIDDVMIGSAYLADFNSSSEGWSSGGDGTMEWMPAGGYEGGFLQISDWASGDWHWLIAPSDWSGDWSSLYGQEIEFWFKTDQPSYSTLIKLTTDPVQRLVVNTPVTPYVPINDSTLCQVEVLPAPEQDITISYTTGDNSCIEVVSSIVVPAGTSTASIYFKAAAGALEGCTSVIEASSPGYLSSRITMSVEDHAGIDNPINHESITIFPNPCRANVSISIQSGKSIHHLMLFDILGNKLIDKECSIPGDIELNVSGQPAGLYFLRLFIGDQVMITKLIVE